MKNQPPQELIDIPEYFFGIASSEIFRKSSYFGVQDLDRLFNRPE